MVMRHVMEDQLARRIAPKHGRLPETYDQLARDNDRPAVLGGRLVSVERPRARTTGGGEVALDSWATFSSKELLDQLTAEERWPA